MKQIEYALPVQNDRRNELLPPSTGWSKYLAAAIDETTPRTVIIREALIPEPRPRWRSMVVATGFQIAITFCLVAVPILFPETFAPVRRYLATQLVKPEAISRWKPEPKRSISLHSHELVQALPPALEGPVPTPRIASPVPRSPLSTPIRSARTNPA